MGNGDILTLWRLLMNLRLTFENDSLDGARKVTIHIETATNGAAEVIDCLIGCGWKLAKVSITDNPFEE